MWRQIRCRVKRECHTLCTLNALLQYLKQIWIYNFYTDLAYSYHLSINLYTLKTNICWIWKWPIARQNYCPFPILSSQWQSKYSRPSYRTALLHVLPTLHIDSLFSWYICHWAVCNQRTINQLIFKFWL